MKTNIEFTTVKSDLYGNPRVVVHFMDFINETDRKVANELCEKGYNGITFLHGIALKRANRIGGKPYKCKDYGGGIVFQCYSENELENSIIEAAKERNYTYKSECEGIATVPECRCMKANGKIYKRLRLPEYEGILTLID